ncbi:MAG: hypothetical protein WC503_03010 [Candidatus Shapirobacteria bacterium]
MVKWKKKNKQRLDLITKFFNTKWQNIDPELYFAIGFEIHRNRFTFLKFFDIIILKQYIHKDKAEKINQSSIFEDFERSVEHIDTTIEGGKTSKLSRYALQINGKQPLAISDYLKNKIGKFFLIYLITKGFIKIPSDGMLQLPYVMINYSDSITRLEKIQNTKDFKKILNKIN